MLEKSGAISKLKAELRSNVFLALYEQDKLKDKIPNRKCDVFSKSEEGRVALSLVRDLLQCLDLNFTLSVFEAEAPCDYHTSTEVESRLKLTSSFDDPLLCSLVESLAKHRPPAKDLDAIFGQQSFFAQLDKKQEKIQDVLTGVAPGAGVAVGEDPLVNKTVVDVKEQKAESSAKSVAGIPKESAASKKAAETAEKNEKEKGVEKVNLKNDGVVVEKLSPLSVKPNALSSLRDLPALQPPSKLPALSSRPPEPLMAAGDSGDDVESLGEDLLSSLGESSTNEASLTRTDDGLKNCEYIENVA